MKRFLLAHPNLSFWTIIVAAFLVAMLLAGCAGKPVIETHVVERLVAVPCEVQMPEECKDAYAVDKVSTKDDALTINRALRSELEERAACEVMLRAAVKGCNQSLGDK